MILKILGSAVAVAASVIAAGAVVSGERRRADQLSALARLVEHVGSQIENFSAPVTEILRNADRELLLRCGAPSPDLSGFDAFLSSCDLALNEEEKNTVFSFSSELGRHFRDEQIKSCSVCSARLRELAENASRELPKKRKVTYTLFVCSALALVIILV